VGNAGLKVCGGNATGNSPASASSADSIFLIFGVCFSQLQIADFVTYHITFWMAMFLILFIELIAV
jgi:hypothetical protein